MENHTLDGYLKICDYETNISNEIKKRLPENAHGLVDILKKLTAWVTYYRGNSEAQDITLDDARKTMVSLFQEYDKEGVVIGKN